VQQRLRIFTSTSRHTIREPVLRMYLNVETHDTRVLQTTASSSVSDDGSEFL